jgi:putative peptide zinc metalloprotease protein
MQTTSGEFTKMLTKRFVRTCFWLVFLAGVGGGLFLIPVDEFHSGDFTLRPAQRNEVRGPVAGFLKEIYVKEGDVVAPGDQLALIEVPDLAQRIEQKQAELAAAEAELQLLLEGVRPEEIADQEARVARRARFYAVAEAELTRARNILAAELRALESRLAAANAAHRFASSNLTRVEALYARDVATQSERDEAREKLNVENANVQYAEAELQARMARGNILAEKDLARTENELYAERGRLALLLAGTRPQAVTAQRANLKRVASELKQLRQQERKLLVCANFPGVVVTPHLREKLGSWVHEGDPICIVEDRSSFAAEIQVTEGKSPRIRPGQYVKLKARALPFDTLEGQITATAQSAEPRDQSQSIVTLYCHVQLSSLHHSSLRSAQTGHARVYIDRIPLGQILLNRGLKLLRTEFWW